MNCAMAHILASCTSENHVEWLIVIFGRVFVSLKAVLAYLNILYEGRRFVVVFLHLIYGTQC